MPETTQEYGPELKELTWIVKENNLTEDHIKKYSGYYRNKTFLTVNDNKLFYLETRYVPDPNVRPRVLLEAHKFHQGITKTQARITEYFLWPTWTADTEKYIRACPECRDSDRTKVTREESMNPVSIPEGP